MRGRRCGTGSLHGVPHKDTHTGLKEDIQNVPLKPRLPKHTACNILRLKGDFYKPCRPSLNSMVVRLWSLCVLKRLAGLKQNTSNATI